MSVALHETCQQYVTRRLSEGWHIAGRWRHLVILSPPDGNFLRVVNLRNDVETLRPDAAGDEENITYVAGDGTGTHYAAVDEVEADDGTTCVYTKVTSFERDLYNLPASAGSGTINKITLYFRVKGGWNVNGIVKGAIKSDTTVTETAEKVPYTDFGANVWGNYSQEWATNPADGEAWEWADIDALQIGISIKSDNVYYVYCTQVYVEVDYTAGAVTEKTSSDTGSGVDAVYSLETGEAKASSDSGSGVEGTPVQSAILAGSEAGSGIEALIARLLVAVDTGYGVEAGDVEVDGQLKDLFASELGQGSDSLAVKIEMPTKGGGMKLWT